MNFRKLLIAFAAIVLMATGAPAFAYPPPYPEPADERSEREADMYEAGADAIDEGKWDEAVRTFASVAEMKGARADGAIFWTAYALNKMGRRAEALRTLDGLQKAHPKSRWLNDAKALEMEMRQAGGEQVSPEGVDDDELKMIAINSLMHTDPEKAFPLLEKIVRGNSSKKIRGRALFILGQSASPRAQTLLADIARGNSNPDMQREAIRYLGMSGNPQSHKLLVDLYSSGASTAVRKEVLRAFMLSGEKSHVTSAAKSERDPALRREAIRTLGLMGGRAELVALYGTESSQDVKKEIIRALFLSGDSDRLGELARSEKNGELRAEAIRSLGLMGAATSNTLLSIYAADNNDDVKNAVIDALFLQSNARALIDLSKKEKNKDLKRKALKKLSIMNDEEALAYMLQILNE